MWGRCVDQEGRRKSTLEEIAWRWVVWFVGLLFISTSTRRLIKSRAVEYFGAFVTYGIDENFSNGFGGETLKERNCLEDLSIDRRIVLNSSQENRLEGWGLDFSERERTSGRWLLAQQWILLFHKKWVISWLLKELLAFEKGSSMESVSHSEQSVQKAIILPSN